jgi:parallel beta-helix repeat protein
MKIDKLAANIIYNLYQMKQTLFKSLLSGSIVCIFPFFLGIKSINAVNKTNYASFSVNKKPLRSTTAGKIKSRAKFTPSKPLNLKGKHDTVISGLIIKGGKERDIVLINCHNVHITHNQLINSAQEAIYLYDCYNITIDRNYFSSVSTGVEAVSTKGGGIVVNNNQFFNMIGPFPRGQFVQFDNVSGPNCSISYNKGENILNQSNAEDAINLFKSNGTAESPIKIIGNWIRGGGPSKTGGGIMLGDNGGSFQYAADNIIVNPGQYGMSISGGDHISIVNNLIYSKSQYFTNIGLFIWTWMGYTPTNSTIKGNKVNFTNSKNTPNHSWIAPGVATPTGWDTNVFGADINESILPAKIVDKIK